MLIWGEARGESLDGKLAVGCVVRNRVAYQPRYGAGYTGVILHPKQFSCFNADDPNAPKLLEPLQHDEATTWSECYDVAQKVYRNEAADRTNGATHYFVAASQRPSWADEMIPAATIGRHLFFRGH